MPFDEDKHHSGGGGGSDEHADLDAVAIIIEQVGTQITERMDKCTACTMYVLGVQLLSKWIAIDTVKRVLNEDSKAVERSMYTEQMMEYTAEVISKLMQHIITDTADALPSMFKTIKEDYREH